ncbi:MAG TPA: DNA methyltransferase [Tepidisphaeraceae bacterium]|jgi:hypothetical protein
MESTSHQWRESRLQEFVNWSAVHITGDEKGEAQTFIERLFIAFGQKGARDVGGVFEDRIKQLSNDHKKTSFADYVWKPVVLIEMKKRGADLAKHRQQAFDYWTHIAPGRPKYVVLCNFDEFWVYDFNNQLYSPKDKVALVDLPTKWGPLAFLFPTNEAPTFGNDREKVTREAADKLAACFTKMITRGVERDLAQRFVLQSMIAMFAEDIGLLPRYMFSKLIEECQEPSDSFDKLGGLFEAMNTNPPVTGGRYKGVRYFNGGVFAHPARVELYPDELAQLRGNGGSLFGAIQSDWSKVEPEIFGAIFQDSMGAEERHAFGAHFTSAEDIMKIVKPTISDPWAEAIARAKTAKDLNGLLERIATLRVLDPACGSGNFLYLAYREMKRLETRIRERLGSEFSIAPVSFAHVNARQFYGMDINPFAVELAKITLMLGRKLAIEELHILDEPDLPLDNLDANFHIGDALMTQTTVDGKTMSIQTPWPAADVIIGNPPFLGAKLLKPERGTDYVNALRKLYADIPGMADYCVYWFRRANDHLPECTVTNRFAGRAGLVGTQNIRNNQSRVGGLDRVVKTGTIIEAVDNQPWSGEANVHVSIVNWSKTLSSGLLPSKRRLWYATTPSHRKRTVKGGPSVKHYELAFRDAASISPSLSDNTDTAAAAILSSSSKPQRVFNGQYPRHQGYRVTVDDARRMIAADQRNAEVVHPFLVGQVMLTQGKPDEWIIDFQERDIVAAQSFRLPFAKLQKDVLPHIAKLAAAERVKTKKNTGQDQSWLNSWWRHFRCRPELVDNTSRLSRYFACVELTKRPIFCFLDPVIRPDKTLEAFAFEDDYSFGIIQSPLHTHWFWAKCSNFKSDPRYTPESVFDTFPWPQSPTKKQIDAVAAAAVAVRRVRAEALAVTTGGLRAVYRTLELPGKHPLKDAHAALDAAVLAAYGFGAKKDLLAQLLELNLAVAAKEKAGEPVTAPGVPASYGDPAALVTDDCIRA